MHFKTIILSLLFLLIEQFTYAQLQEVKSTYISCNVKNKIDVSTTFAYTEGLFYPEWKEYSREALGKDNLCDFTVDLPKITQIRISHDYRYFDLYCEPGDSMSLHFNAENYPTKIQFSGSRASENTFLHAFRQHFISYSVKEINYQIATLSSIQFRKYMDNVLRDKWAFYHQYLKNNNPKWSEDFKIFFQAEVNYWYAYNLMHYQESHLSAASVESLYLPDAYFDFLNEIVISSDANFIHPNYTKFLKLYYQFRLQKPDFPYGLASKQLIAVPLSQDAILYNDIECTKIIGKLPVNEQVIVMQKTSFQAQHQRVPLVYRLQCRTIDGHYGWLKSTDVEVYNFTPKLNQNQLYIKNYDVETRRDFTRCTIIEDSLGLFDDPTSKIPLIRLPIGAKLSVLNEATKDNISYDSEKGDYVAAPFVKVRTVNGMMGWLSVAGMQTHLLKDSNFEFKSKIASISKSDFYNLDFFFYDKSLYYTFGEEIIEKLLFNGKDRMKPYFDFYQKKCPYPDLKEEMELVFSKKDKLFDFDTSLIIIKEQLFDQRSSNLNQRTGAFSLAKDDNAFKKGTEKAFSNLFFSGIETDSVCQCDPITYPEVTYETKMVEIRGLKRLFNKYNFKLSIYPDIVNHIEKNPVPQILKRKKFLQEDTLCYRFAIVEPVLARLTYKGKAMELWLEPGQKFNISEVLNDVVLEGESSAPMLYLNEIARSMHNLDSIFYKNYQLSDLEFKKLVSMEYIKQKESFSYFLARAKISRTFLKTAEADIDYWYVNHLLRFAYSKPKDYKMNINYFDFLQEIKIQNERGILSKSYQEFVEIYLNKQIQINQHLKITDQNVARMTFSGRVLNFWEAKYISENLKNGFNVETLKYAQKFVDECTYTVLIESVKNAVKIANFNLQKFQTSNFALTTTKNKALNNVDWRGKNTAIIFLNKNDDKITKEKQKNLEKNATKLGYITYFVNIQGSYHDWKRRIPMLHKSQHLYYEDANIYAANVIQDLTQPILLFDKKGIFNKRDLRTVIANVNGKN